MAENIKEIYGKLDEISKDINRIKFILESDPTTNEKGLVENVAIMKKDLDELILEKEVSKGKATVWGIIGGAILSIGIYLAKLLFTKSI